MALASWAAKMRRISPSQPLGLIQLTVQRDGERQIAVGDSIRLQLYQGVPQAARFRIGGAVHHCRAGSLGFLHVRHHGVPLGEVVALRPANLSPG